jgi:hypothetical protein
MSDDKRAVTGEAGGITEQWLRGKLLRDWTAIGATATSLTTDVLKSACQLFSKLEPVFQVRVLLSMVVILVAVAIESLTQHTFIQARFLLCLLCVEEPKDEWKARTPPPIPIHLSILSLSCLLSPSSLSQRLPEGLSFDFMLSLHYKPLPSPLPHHCGNHCCRDIAIIANIFQLKIKIPVLSQSSLPQNTCMHVKTYVYVDMYRYAFLFNVYIKVCVCVILYIIYLYLHLHRPLRKLSYWWPSLWMEGASTFPLSPSFPIFHPL